MTLPMIIALAVTVLMIILIMVDKLPFGAPPLLALLLLALPSIDTLSAILRRTLKGQAARQSAARQRRAFCGFS